MKAKSPHSLANQGYLLVEAAVGLSILIFASAAVLPMIHSAGFAVQDSLHDLWAEQYLFNQATRIRAAAIHEDGSLLLPDMGLPLSFHSTEQIAQRDVALSSQHPDRFKGDIITQHRLIGTLGSGKEGESLWEYQISIQYPSTLPDGTQRNIRKTTTVRKSFSH